MSRIKQEKMRTAQRMFNFEATQDNNGTGKIFDNALNSTQNTPQEFKYEYAPHILSTEMCVYINAVLVGGVFVLGIMRYKIIQTKHHRRHCHF